MEDKTFQKYKLVIDEWFINGWNGTKAYQKFYPKANDKVSGVEFIRILAIPSIEDYVKDKKVEAQIILQTSHGKLLEELRNWAYSDITETLMLSPDALKELPIEIRRLITKFKTTTKNYTIGDTTTVETVVELWFVSKEKAMDMIHKHVGFYEKDNKQKTSDSSSIDYSKYTLEELKDLKELLRKGASADED